MQKLHFSIQINAPKEKVWDTMLNKETYEQWTTAFGHPGSYEGDWNEGSDINFLAPNEKGTMDGMLSHVKENRLYEFLSLEHQGVMIDGKESTDNDWAGALENYTFTEKDGGTEVTVDIDVDDEMVEEFQTAWPLALQKLKELSEKSSS